VQSPDLRSDHPTLPPSRLRTRRGQHRPQRRPL